MQISAEEDKDEFPLWVGHDLSMEPLLTSTSLGGSGCRCSHVTGRI